MYKTNFMMMDNNSVKRFKQSKDCEKSLGKNEQEVLVLPPNLLQELGINLGNIQNTSCYPVVKDNSEPNNLQTDEKSKINSEQLDDVAKEVTGLVCEKSVQLSPPILPSNNIPQQKQEYIIGNNVASTSNIDHNNININLNQNRKEIDKNTEIQKQSSVESNSDIKYQKKSNVCNDKQSIKIDEFNSLNPQSSHLNSSNGKKSKINIISHEVVKHVSDETFNTLKICPTPRSTFIPFKIHTLIERIPNSTSMSDNVTSDTREHTISLEPQFDNDKMLKTNDSACSIKTEENDLPTNNLNNYPDIHDADCLVPDTDKEPEANDITEIYCVIDEVDNIREESNLATCTENKTVDIDMSDEMPTPSTSLVSQISDDTLTDVYEIKIEEVDKDDEIRTEKNNNISETFDESNISASDKQSIDVSWRNSVIKNPDYMNKSLLEKVKMSSHHLTTKSKLCIQGVEKPGGRIESVELQTDMILRTYLKRQTRNEFNSKTGDVILNNELTAKTYEIVDKCTDFNNIDVTCITKQVSPCNEFGRLHFDDDVNECGHFHFLPKNTEQSASSSFETFSEEHEHSNEESFNEANNTYGNDVQINDLSDTCHSELSSISENDIREQLNEDQKLFSSETYVNLYDECINDDIKSDDLYSTEVKEEIFDDNLLDQSDPDEEQELFITETHRNYYRRISTAEEVGETSEAYITKKRKRTSRQEEEGILLHSIHKNYYNAPDAKKNISCVKCAVCRKEVPEVDWDSHLYEEHCYIAWKEGSSIIDLHDEELIKKLSEILEKLKSLYCTFCGQKGRNLNRMLAHFKICITKIFMDTNSNDDVNTKIKSELVKCGVCKMEMSLNDWNDHIQKEHNYLAWKDGDPELNLDDGWKIQIHLQNILNDIGRLVCGKCDLVRHYTKSFMKHIKKCDGSRLNYSISDSVECGVCSQKVAGTEWLEHIYKEHNYLAKIRGAPPLDLSNDDAVKKHLQGIRSITGRLTCVKCGLTRKIIKNFMEHIKECGGTFQKKMNVTTKNVEAQFDNSICEKVRLQYSGTVQCGVCKEQVDGAQWLQHIQKEHNYIAWLQGEQPLNFLREEYIWQYLNDVKKITGVLICVKCGQNRKYGKAYMEHINECDGSKINQDVKFEYPIHRSQNLSVSSTEEGDEACITQKRKRTLTDDEGTSLQSTKTISRNAPNAKKISSCVKCGVCLKEVPEVDWDSHLYENHCHIGWKKDSSIIDLDDKELIQKLTKTLKKDNGLYCTFCGQKQRDLKKFMSHLKICITKIFTNVNITNANYSEDVKIENDGIVKCEIFEENVPVVDCTEHVDIEHVDIKPCIDVLPAATENVIKIEHVDEQEIKSELIKCGVCKMEMSLNDWNDHIQKEHNYLAWKDGDPELDLADENQIYICLLNVVDRIGGLVCCKCGLVRHYPKSFMKHINKCNGKEANTCHNDSVVVDQSNDDVNQTQEDDSSLALSDSVECGVCSQKVAGTEWLDHIHKEHNYLAKIRGAPPLDLSNDDAVKKHLQGIRSITGRLTCAKCGMKRKIIKNFMEHIKECGGTFQKKMNVTTKNVEAQLDNSICEKVRLQYSGTVQCGVCKEQVDGAQWLQHIQKEHDYIAWLQGEQPLNFELEEETWQYLNNVARKAGVLICGKCGLYRKYGKAYMQHVKECDGSKAALVDQLNVSQMMENDISSTYLDDCINYGDKVKCGVCAAEMEGARWLQHIQEEHNYMAWVEGRTPLYPDDKEFINTYLKLLIKHTGALICGKCGLPRKLAKYYLQHVSKCGETKEEVVSGSQDNVEEEENEFVHSAAVQCGECLQQVPGSQWILHIRLKHDYLARIAGKPPIDVNDEEQVRNHLSALRKYVDQLICSNCGEGHKHVRAFLKHFQHCDGAEKSDNGSDDMEIEEESFIPNGTVRCGVCRHEVRGEEWINHIHKEHDYMATIEGKPLLILDDEEEIRTHLNTVRRYVRELVCNKCGESRKFVKSYMKHIKNCVVSERVSTDTRVESGRDSVASVATEEDKEFQVEFPGTVVCGVCDREVYGNQWVHHIRTEHNYMAHVKGKTPLDMNNNKQIKAHLNAVSKYAGGLYCNKCGLMRLYVKSYLAHVHQCGNSDSPFTVDANNSVNKKESDESFNPNDTTKVSNKAKNTEASHFVYEGNAICGVCRSEVTRKEWINHIQKQHNYLAWVDGETPLDLEDQEQVHAHLYELSRLQNGLTCNICDAKRKYVKSFLDHVRNCSDITQGGIVECAVCSDTMPVEEWRNHAMKNHYNIAWTVGSDPIDLKNPYAVEKYLKEYKKIEKNLICKSCKLTRVSCAGFYAHIITCGKTDEEIEDFKSVCDICNSKYLCIYKNQHLAFHREQEYLKEKKSRALELVQSKTEEGGTPGRRRAAEKAKNVIEDYKSKLKHKCASCSFGTDVEEELEGHVCASSDTLSDSDSSSLQFEHSDTDSDVDSDLSMEEEQQAIDKKKRIDTPPKVSHHIPFKLKSSSNYIAQAGLDFHNTHYTLDELFPDWKPKGCQEVHAEDLLKYLPTVEESCKVKIGNGDWTTYKCFDAKYGTVISVFVGGSIRCVSWAAARGAAAERSYLAVAGPGAPDAPRLPADQLREHPALIQLWDFGDFQSEPQFVLGLALDYGTVWAMEWCPSGARDCPPQCAGAGVGAEEGAGEGHAAEARLGLLALACSNGSVYILPVPHPTHTAKIPQIIKMTPSVELRLCSSEDRKKYQATAISWSKQKGHAIILVGYADGSTAFYDLGCDSPLLKSVENNITILYPFQDDRPHNTCISDVDLFACGAAEGGGGGGAWGAWGGASCTGVHAALRAAAPRLHAPLATAATRFTPHWPSLLVTADEAIANYMTNELEWHGGGRRLGGQRALAACARCGAAAALTPPALRLTRTHPAYRDPRRDVVGMLHMVSLAKKRSKHINDELSMKIEPLTYEDAVKEYGIELKLKSQMTKADQQVVVSEAKAQFPERFPLADVPALAFCPAPAAHARLALPTHAGVLFIITV